MTGGECQATAGKAALVTAIIEYVYKAEGFCPGCVLPEIGKPRLPGRTVEASLAIYAVKEGIEYVRREHDPRFFPLPSQAGIDELHRNAGCGEAGLIAGTTGSYEPGCYATCGTCGKRLGGSCPPMAAITEAEHTARSWLSWWPSFAQWREANDEEGTLREYEAAAWSAYTAKALSHGTGGGQQ